MKDVVQNAVSVLLFMGVMSLTVSAADFRYRGEDVRYKVTQIISQQKTQLEKYREGLLSLTPTDKSTPTQGELLPILHELVSYNSQLDVTGWNEQAHQLAAEINKPLMIYWNKHRGNGFIEIVDTYIPDNHGDAALAKLEFLVKKNLISFEDWVQNKGLADMLPDDFHFAEAEMRIMLATLHSRDAQSIVRSLVNVAAAYNQLYQDENTRPLALQLYKTYFRQPIATGWQRTVTVKELRSQYGMATYTTPFSADELKNRYAVSQEEAETLYAFFSHYYN